MKILVINGPNLNMLGVREPEIYGTQTLEDIYQDILKKADDLNTEIEFFQSNIEGEIVSKIQDSYKYVEGIIINPGAYSHYSLAICDALATVKVPAIEVHISNIFSREEKRQKLATAPACIGLIAGLGANGYILALEALNNIITKRQL